MLNEMLLNLIVRERLTMLKWIGKISTANSNFQIWKDLNWLALILFKQMVYSCEKSSNMRQNYVKGSSNICDFNKKPRTGLVCVMTRFLGTLEEVEGNEIVTSIDHSDKWSEK